MQSSSEKWPEALDALTVSQQQHKLLFENDLVCVIDALIPAEEMTAVHTYQWPACLYIISWSDFIRNDACGNVMLASRKLNKTFSPSTAMWSEPLAPHALKNICDKDLKVICVEIKN
jgi:hypothetical protein